MKVRIIGVGPGDEHYLCLAAKKAILDASLVLATPRLFDVYAHLTPRMKKLSLSDVERTLLSSVEGHEDVAVLVSGDVGFFSASTKLLKALVQYPHVEVTCVNGLSSLQYLCAKVGVAYEGVKSISLHGRRGSIVPFASYHPCVFALSGGAIRAHHIIEELIDANLGETLVTVGENLSAPNERILTETACNLAQERFGDLACVLVRNQNYVNPHAELRDEDFTRGKVPMTKQAVRSVVLASLDIQPWDLVWDVGAGTGAVAIAMARKSYENYVYAVEKKAEAIALLRCNSERLGAHNMRVVEGVAPECLGTLPAPDKVFIGGSSGNLESVVALALKVNPLVRIVVTAISLETLSEAMTLFEKKRFQVEAVCINAAVSHKVGEYHLMKAENPVYIITARQSTLYDDSGQTMGEHAS